MKQALFQFYFFCCEKIGKVTIHYSGKVKAESQTDSHISTSVRSREKHAPTLPACCWMLGACNCMPAAGCCILATECLLLHAYRWMPTAGCYMPAAACLLLQAYCWMSVARCCMLAAACLLLQACCWMFAPCQASSLLSCQFPVLCQQNCSSHSGLGLPKSNNKIIPHELVTDQPQLDISPDIFWVILYFNALKCETTH